MNYEKKRIDVKTQKEIENMTATLAQQQAQMDATGMLTGVAEILLLMAESVTMPAPPSLPSRKGYTWKRRYSPDDHAIVYIEEIDPEYVLEQAEEHKEELN